MNETLLPAGCYDVLPPFARLESKLEQQLLTSFEQYGYAQVSPPLCEYTDSLLKGRGAILSPQVVRMMDPHNQKVMGIRADMTLQIGRIALSRMETAPRPLRLCYSGQVLRMRQQTTANRQLQQTGIELVGSNSLAADVEVMKVSLSALQAIGIGHITLDINLPAFIGAVLSESPLDDQELSAVFHALENKDEATLRAFKEPACDLLCTLMLVSGTAKEQLEQIAKADLPDAVQGYVEDLRGVIGMLGEFAGSDVTVSLDVTERSGLDYYSGISFALFATEHQLEIGRGGRYTIDYYSKQESAIGSTLYIDKIKRIIPAMDEQARVCVPVDTDKNTLKDLHDQGFATIFALPDGTQNDISSIARSLGCGYIYQSGKLETL